VSGKRGQGGSRGLTPARRWAVSLGAAAATLVAIALLTGLWAAWVYKGPGPAAKADGFTTVILRHGSSLTEIACPIPRWYHET